MTPRAWWLVVVLAGACGEAPPQPETLRACRRLARMPTVEVLQSRGGYRHAIVLSAVLPDQPAGGVLGAATPAGWQIQYATRQLATVEGDPIVRSRTYATKAAGTVSLTFPAPPADRSPSAVDLDLTFDFVDTGGVVTRWAVAAAVPVEQCE